MHGLSGVSKTLRTADRGTGEPSTPVHPTPPSASGIRAWEICPLSIRTDRARDEIEIVASQVQGTTLASSQVPELAASIITADWHILFLEFV